MFHAALRRWDELNIPLHKAMCQMDFAITVGGPETTDAAREAEAFFEEAGNHYFVRRLEEARV
jgi:hypothetical protein